MFEVSMKLTPDKYIREKEKTEFKMKNSNNWDVY